MAHAFRPITLKPFSRAQKKRLISIADDPAKTYDFPFNLSEHPPAKWVQLFQVVWYQHYGGSAIPRFDGETVLIGSSPGDLQIALSSLKLIVASTNERYAEFERRRDESEDAQQRGQTDSKRGAEKLMSDALDGLKF